MNLGNASKSVTCTINTTAAAAVYVCKKKKEKC